MGSDNSRPVGRQPGRQAYPQSQSVNNFQQAPSITIQHQPLQQSRSSYNIPPSYKPYQTTPLYPVLNAPQTYPMHTMLIKDDLLNRFLEVQAEIVKFDGSGVFEGLTKVEADFEAATKNKKQADVSYKVLCEQSNKEKLDYENITSPTVQGYFRTRQDHERAIEKEKVSIDNGKLNFGIFN